MGRLVAVVESLDYVPEGLREFYVLSGNQFLLAVDGVEDVRGLKSALGKERIARKDMKLEVVNLTRQLELKNKVVSEVIKEMRVVTNRFEGLVTELKRCGFNEC